jgi:hypothetical protein
MEPMLKFFKTVSKCTEICHGDADPLFLLRVVRPPGQDLLILELKWLFWFQTGILQMNTEVPHKYSVGFSKCQA